MSEEDLPTEKKDATERRVYNLPAGLLARLRAYQVAHSIGSEAEAARRLLDYALQMRDTVFNILDSLETRFAEEKDLRVLAGEILTKHMLVAQVRFNDESISFKMNNGMGGKMNVKGLLWSQDADEDDNYWSRYQKPVPKPARAPSWDANVRGAGDLDDEIPF